jgi:hypothetical protein
VRDRGSEIRIPGNVAQRELKLPDASYFPRTNSDPCIGNGSAGVGNLNVYSPTDMR